MPQANMSSQAQLKVDPSEAKISAEARSPDSILKEFFFQREPAFSRLVAIREKVGFRLMASR
jgi:hypothetical protein